MQPTQSTESVEASSYDRDCVVVENLAAAHLIGKRVNGQDTIVCLDAYEHAQDRTIQVSGSLAQNLVSSISAICEQRRKEAVNLTTQRLRSRLRQLKWAALRKEMKIPDHIRSRVKGNPFAEQLAAFDKEIALNDEKLKKLEVTLQKLMPETNGKFHGVGFLIHQGVVRNGWISKDAEGNIISKIKFLINEELEAAVTEIRDEHVLLLESWLRMNETHKKLRTEIVGLETKVSDEDVNMETGEGGADVAANVAAAMGAPSATDRMLAELTTAVKALVDSQAQSGRPPVRAGRRNRQTVGNVGRSMSPYIDSGAGSNNFRSTQVTQQRRGRSRRRGGGGRPQQPMHNSQPQWNPQMGPQWQGAPYPYWGQPPNFSQQNFASNAQRGKRGNGRGRANRL